MHDVTSHIEEYVQLYLQIVKSYTNLKKLCE